MIYIGIDASYNCLGYTIVSEDKRIIELGSLTPADYSGERKERRYDHFYFNSMKIFNALLLKLMPYRDEDMIFALEEVAINGWNRGGTNSIYNLVFELGLLSGLLSKTLNTPPLWVAPSTHKKWLTNNGKAKKELSVSMLLHRIPQLNVHANKKLDDVADAFALCLVLANRQIDVSEYSIKTSIA